MSVHKQPRSRRRNREEWAQLLRAYEESSLDQRQFCQKHGLGYSTFGKWKKRLCAASNLPEADLIEITPIVTEPPSHWEVELTLGSGMVLRVRAWCCGFVATDVFPRIPDAYLAVHETDRYVNRMTGYRPW